MAASMVVASRMMFIRWSDRSLARPIALSLLLCGTLLGCGPTGRDLSDAQWLQMQRDLQRERAEVGRQRDQLEADRRQWEQRARREPILAAAITSSVTLLGCLAPVLLVLLLLGSRREPPATEAACEVLLDKLIADLHAKSHVGRLLTPPDPKSSPEDRKRLS